MVIRAEKTTEFATEVPSEEVAKESNMAAALLLVDHPEGRFIKTRKKQAKDALQTNKGTCNLDLFKGELPGR